MHRKFNCTSELSRLMGTQKNVLSDGINFGHAGTAPYRTRHMTIKAFDTLLGIRTFLPFSLSRFNPNTKRTFFIMTATAEFGLGINWVEFGNMMGRFKSGL